MKETPPPSTSPWDAPERVDRLSRTPPNAVLMRFAAEELHRSNGIELIDIGCGAGCNALPLAKMGWRVLGIDLSEPMLKAAARRIGASGSAEDITLKQAAMTSLPVPDRSRDFIVAHGIWNLAASAGEFRQGLAEAARIAKPGAPLFVYVFSRRSLPLEAEPVAGESFTFMGNAGRPQCYLTSEQLIDELGLAGFAPESGTAITEYPCTESRPAILEGIFRRQP